MQRFVAITWTLAAVNQRSHVQLSCLFAYDRSTRTKGLLLWMTLRGHGVGLGGVLLHGHRVPRQLVPPGLLVTEHRCQRLVLVARHRARVCPTAALQLQVFAYGLVEQSHAAPKPYCPARRALRRALHD